MRRWVFLFRMYIEFLGAHSGAKRMISFSPPTKSFRTKSSLVLPRVVSHLDALIHKYASTQFTEWVKAFVLERLDIIPLKNLSPLMEIYIVDEIIQTFFFFFAYMAQWASFWRFLHCLLTRDLFYGCGDGSGEKIQLALPVLSMGLPSFGGDQKTCEQVMRTYGPWIQFWAGWGFNSPQLIVLSLANPFKPNFVSRIVTFTNMKRLDP